jgi:hypothetical protein
VPVAAADLPLAASIILDPVGQCGEATFADADHTCALNGKQKKVTCK